MKKNMIFLAKKKPVHKKTKRSFAVYFANDLFYFIFSFSKKLIQHEYD